MNHLHMFDPVKPADLMSVMTSRSRLTSSCPLSGCRTSRGDAKPAFWASMPWAQVGRGGAVWGAIGWGMTGQGDVARVEAGAQECDGGGLIVTT
jgi:hypothetical protein